MKARCCQPIPHGDLAMADRCEPQVCLLPACTPQCSTLFLSVLERLKPSTCPWPPLTGCPGVQQTDVTTVLLWGALDSHWTWGGALFIRAQINVLSEVPTQPSLALDLGWGTPSWIEWLLLAQCSGVSFLMFRVLCVVELWAPVWLSGQWLSISCYVCHLLDERAHSSPHPQGT